MTEKYNLSWSNFQNHTSSAFQDLLEQADFVDVTLACEEDKHITAHKIILSACSPFFRTILQRNPHQRPLIFLDGVKQRELVAIIDFIYLGRAEVSRDGIEEFMRVGRKLKISGLTTEDIPKNQTDLPKCKQQDETSTIKKDTTEKMEIIDSLEKQSAEESSNHTSSESDMLLQGAEDNDEKDLLEETVVPSTGPVEHIQANPKTSENVVIDDVAKECNVAPNNTVLIEKAKDTISVEASESQTMGISEMLKGDLVPGLVLTKNKEQETPISKSKSKKKVKEQAVPSYSCDDCDFKAAEIGNLRMHTFYKHGAKTYKCDQCDFKAQRQSGLKFHQSMKHGRYGR